MDVYFPLNGITFIWNEQKARANPIKHDGVTFPQAAEAFFDYIRTVSARKATRQEREYYEA